MKNKLFKTLLIVCFGMLISSCGGETTTSSTEPTPTHEHKYSNEYKIDGDYHYQICTICGEPSEKVYHSGGHSSCIEKAHCEFCGVEYGDYDDHNYEGVEYTFDDDFHYRECTICHEIEKCEHIFNREVIKDECLAAPKTDVCLENNAYYYSCICGEHSSSAEEVFLVRNEHEFTSQEVLPGEANKIHNSTCMHGAEYGMVCTHCHSAYDVDHTFFYGPATGHSVTLVPIVESTCSKHGIAQHYHCSLCGKNFLDSEAMIEKTIEELTLPLKEHTYVLHEPTSSLLKRSIQPYYTCDDRDHEDALGKYFIKEGLIYRTATESEIFVSQKQLEDDSYGTEENPYIIVDLDEMYEFRTAVNGGNTFANKFVKLGSDIIIRNGHSWTDDCIGNNDGHPFCGTFDGDNHTIVGFSKDGSDAVALFSRLTDGVVKNLKMSDVYIHYKGTHRGAAVAARVSNATIENVHVLSGSIGKADAKVKAQNGGIAAFVMVGAKIKNCSSYLDIYSNSTSNGGIVGIAYNTDPVNLEITDCVNYGNISGGAGNNGGIYGGSTLAKLTLTVTNCINYGSVTGTGNGTSGIVAATGGGGTSVTVVTNCVNYGTISGAAYVGGIGGIFREGNKTTSLISNCTNKGSISGTGVGVGGISGISRVDTTNCHCLYSVKVKNVNANTLNAIGSTVSGTGGAEATPGYIAGSAGNDATVTGNLIDESGNPYVSA